MAIPQMNFGNNDEQKLDMTPMIDIIFLLLIFFILTTNFISSEKVISSLLPTNKGPVAIEMPIVEPPDDINVCLFPEGLPPGAQPSVYDRLWKENVNAMRRTAVLRVGKRGQAIVLNGRALETGDGKVSGAEVGKITEHLKRELAARERTGSRKDQAAVVIHCFSGMPWKFALSTYDAVRAYEAGIAGTSGSRKGGMLSIEAIANSREVDFAPPRIRNYHTWELGNELWEIQNMK
jgi:hypothetical protein